MEAVEVRGFPLPPSANNVYSNTSRGRIKNAVYKQYEQECHHWRLNNGYSLNYLRDWVLQIPAAHAIRIDRMYHMMPHKILTNDMRPRRNDTFNRIKVMDDCLAKLLDIDDSYFWCGHTDKQPITIEGLPECVDFRLSMVDLRIPRRLGDPLD